MSEPLLRRVDGLYSGRVSPAGAAAVAATAAAVFAGAACAVGLLAAGAGPAYRDLDDPGAALFHISVADMDTAMGWFRSDTFKEATRLAKVTGRSFYLAQPQA